MMDNDGNRTHMETFGAITDMRLVVVWTWLGRNKGESGPEMLGFPPTTDGPLRTPPAQVQGSAPSATFSTVGLFFFFLLSAANGKLQLPRLGLA